MGHMATRPRSASARRAPDGSPCAAFARVPRMRKPPCVATPPNIVINRPADGLVYDAVRSLFIGYADSHDFSLAYQDFDAELADLPSRYAPPSVLFSWLVSTASLQEPWPYAHGRRRSAR